MGNRYTPSTLIGLPQPSNSPLGSGIWKRCVCLKGRYGVGAEAERLMGRWNGKGKKRKALADGSGDVDCEMEVGAISYGDCEDFPHPEDAGVMYNQAAVFNAAPNRWMSAYGEKIKGMGEMRKEGNWMWKALRLVCGEVREVGKE